MERRDVLKSVGGIGTASVLGLGGVMAFSGSAAAVSNTLNITNSDVSNEDGDLSKVVMGLNHTVEWDNFDVGVDAVSYTDKITIKNQAGNVQGTHTLLDDYMVDFEDFGATGTGSGSWGNNESYDFDVVDEDDTGPGPSVLDGSLTANILWTVLADPNISNPAQSLETPAILGSDVNDLDVDTDNSSETYTITHEKIVKFYREGPNGGYAQLGSDGTFAQSKATGEYKVTVGNKKASESSTGSGDSSAS